ncbi:HAD hydrolase-like protein [bacterium BFN5]|nr:HAD hydrolase-like protein [bacterium BFN5]
MKILFWDIDGTLIRTAKAGLFAFEQAVTEIYCREIDYSKVATSGMTDNHIAAQVIAAIQDGQASSQDISKLTKRYEELLPAHLAERKGFILPSVKEILAHLKGNEDYVCLLLTGNSRCGSEIKLNFYDLAQYFNFDASAFCGHQIERNDIARTALSTIAKLYPEVTMEDVYVIGDTPNDINCGKTIGAKTIAVATGNYSYHQLSEYSPWWVVDKLPEPEEFVKRLAE